MEKVFTNIEHVSWLREQARLKRPYWYGTYFNKCSEKLLQRKAGQYPEHYGAKRMPIYRKHIEAKQICGDCVNGAIKGAVWSELGKREPVYASHGCPDKNADGMFSYCKSIGMDWGTIGSIPDIPGIAVRFGGHVGVYVGNGEVVEWRGFDHGCVITKLNNRKWTHWYKLPWTEYVSEKSESSITVGTLGSRLLKKGHKGEDVKMLQELLMHLGYSLPKYGADADYGSETEAAVRKFQQKNRIGVDGKYGAESHKAMMSIIAELNDGEEVENSCMGYVQVTGGTVNIRKGTGTKYDIVTVVRKGTKLPYSAVASNGWFHVEIDGLNGWISNDYTKVV